MTVSRILEKKGSEAPTVQSTDTIERALEVLAQHDVGAVVVTNDGRDIAGIISERDIVRAFRTHGADTLALAVTTVMTPNPYTCTAQDRVDVVLATMDERKFRHAPVVADGQLAGLISIRDIVKLKLDEVQSEANAIREYIAA